ncbi:MAG: MBL fold metallo-hydrolase [Clostridia bacterium]|nr:MBL fold metallo-hydrolase [Clostridia bacterium]
MKITWYGTASVLLQSGETGIMIDPYLKDLPKGAEPQEMHDARLAAYSSQSNILVTHGHLDHIEHIPYIYSERECTVYCSKTPYHTLSRHKFPEEKMTLISPGDEFQIGPFSILVFQGKHVHFDGRLIRSILFSGRTWRHFFRAVGIGLRALRYPEKDETLFYEIRAEGKRIQVMGSADLRDDVQYPEGADVLIMAHQGRSDIDSHNAALAERLAPKRILLDHCDDAFPPISSYVPTDDFCASMQMPTQRLIEGETLEI